MRAVLVLAAGVLALITFGASAQPSAPPDPPAICNIWRTQWNDVSARDAAAPMQSFLARVPGTCRNLRGQITAFIARRFPPVTTTTATVPPQTTPRRTPAQTATATTPAPVRFRDCGDCPEMVVIPAGHFNMGSGDERYGTNEWPMRSIAFASDFAVGRYEVTRAQYSAFMQATGRADGGYCRMANLIGGYEQNANANWRNPGFAQGEDHPVVCVSWEDAQAYVQWLNTQTPGGYRLLSEAEWEYAARAGTFTAFVSGRDATCGYANGFEDASSARSCVDGVLYTAPVGSFGANAFGLSDMIGNVWEWTQDCYDSTLAHVPPNGTADETDSCSSRVVRGGGWITNLRDLRPAVRGGEVPANRGNFLGFRVARTL